MNGDGVSGEESPNAFPPFSKRLAIALNDPPVAGWFCWKFLSICSMLFDLIDLDASPKCETIGVWTYIGDVAQLLKFYAYDPLV
jgi:hypothetical protein